MLDPLKNIKNNVTHTDVATYSGVINKTLLLLICLTLFTLLSYTFITSMLLALYLLVSSVVVGLTLLVIAPSLVSYKTIAVPYSILEGISVGAITYILEQKFPGVGVKSVVATILSFTLLYILYSYKIIKVTDKLRKYNKALLITACISLLILVILSFCNIIFITPILGIIIFIIILLVGLSTLLIDFDDVFKAVTNKVDKEEEWTLAISLILSIILIYESFLRVFGFSSEI